MANIKCAWCEYGRAITHGSASREMMADWVYKDTLRGALTCGHCDKITVFEMKGNELTYLPGKIFQEDMRHEVPENVAESLIEAVLCFHGTAYRGTVAMCRSAVEDALDTKGAKGNNLDQKIVDGQNRLQILGYEEIAQAHGARLAGRNALHRGAAVSQSQAMLALQTTLDLLNHIALQTPALQSGTDSNGP